MEGKDAQRGIELLKGMDTLELAAVVPYMLCPVYVRGQAYLALHDGKAAAAEFQKFIDRKGITQNMPWGSLARLGVARAYVVQGETAKAKKAYEDFLGIWKDADGDVPILKEAEAEYAKLR